MLTPGLKNSAGVGFTSVFLMQHLTAAVTIFARLDVFWGCVFPYTGNSSLLLVAQGTKELPNFRKRHVFA